MKKIGALVVAAVSLTATSAFAADMPAKAKPAPAVVAAPSPWDIAFGGYIMSDYNFRGISQSDRGPAAGAYFEPRYNFNKDLQLYAGIAGTSVDLPTRPGAEIDLYFGIRPTFGDFAFDLGFMYYLYPNETQFCGIPGTCPGQPGFANGNTTLANTDFWEVYGKVAWTVNPVVTIGANVFYSPSWLNTGADGLYASATGKITMPGTMMPPDIGMYLSGEFGHYWLGTTDLVPGVFVSNSGATGWNLPDYNYWNLGVGFTYKVFTLDLRYHDTDLSKAECNALTADPGAAATGPVVINNLTTTAASKWCGAAFIAKLSFDLTASANLK